MSLLETVLPRWVSIWYLPRVMLDWLWGSRHMQIIYDIVCFLWSTSLTLSHLHKCFRTCEYCFFLGRPLDTSETMVSDRFFLQGKYFSCNSRLLMNCWCHILAVERKYPGDRERLARMSLIEGIYPFEQQLVHIQISYYLNFRGPDKASQNGTSCLYWLGHLRIFFSMTM